MKHRLPVYFFWLTACCLLLLSAPRAWATHAQGGELTYEAIGPPGSNRYRVTCRFFRDCSGNEANPELTLNCRVGSPATSCNTVDVRNFSATLLRGPLTAGSPWCANVPGGPTQCLVNGLTNYETARYTAEITLPPAPEWTLSVEISNRPSLANIPSYTDLRYEATLNNLLPLPGGPLAISNTSPQYQDQDIPVPFVCVGQRTQITFSTIEPDGDSLVYSLDRPLQGCNQFTTYESYSPLGGLILDPSNSPTTPCVVTIPGGTAVYSPTFPIGSYTFGGSCPVRTATPFFAFNAQAGNFTFTPAFYFPGPSSDGRNKYAVVGKVTEYRRVGGRYYKVGSVRRDMLVVVIDCGGNQVPNAPRAVPMVREANQVVTNTDSTIVVAQTCEYTELDINFRDPNPADQLTVTFAEPTQPAYAALYRDPSNITARPFTLQGNGTNAPVGKLRLRPDISLAGRTFRIPVRIEDDACPVRAVQNRIIVVQVARRSFADVVVAGTNPPKGSRFRRDTLVARRDEISLTARPNRPLTVNNIPVGYTYSWRASTPAGTSGLGAGPVNSASIRVRPGTTTRYSVTVTPTELSQGCADTASFVVRVVPQVPNAFTPNGDGVNDVFVIKDPALPAQRLEIFNRWGRKVAEWADYQNNWDGAGHDAGVYYYQITLGNGTRRKGWVELMR
ncbi:gliding motility-associated C-terminal domain-containing protein [Hymenobacter oligotrophus]|uniref:Gliding motility-associated C-terminal domain-containing protein n=1 Tax=Hymenobacter oligotrophus TaxID=2319843 RepID=A0A3B7RCK8_9BACT|nr:gliding motility-associated C-terminal domain-containing protein [Hymenobacter oligotrophus]AYA38369.1 gliding motility-associated C-terminal domain-containing protein [Hymenobacter oligotrophus]